ncbi:DoxX family protein [Pontibacter chitinilyticus]|uniref:DoxX family protein n=1 Tax=Pontibacter chitinilyticus TaxID=2674989 RepID=UPI00321A1EB1
MKNASLGYLFARLPIGMSMFGHGLVRLPKLIKFSEGLASSFKDSWLSEAVVQQFAYFLPYLELNIGALLLLGLFTRVVSAMGVLLMVVLIFGSCLLESWNNVAVQMFYGVYFAGLMAFEHRYNRYSIDNGIRGRRIKKKQAQAL